MKTKVGILLIALLHTFFVGKADEGMWIPLYLKKYNIRDMQKKGFKLTAEDIYSVNKACMKDAVMIFGGGCTGELISDKGLIITNHHCGFGSIQSHSSLDHDYLTDGFWAKTEKDELPNPGLSVRFLVHMEEVTDQVLRGADEKMSADERQKIIKGNIQKLREENGKNNNFKIVIKPFFAGNQYFMFVERVFKDIRLVGAPPSAIGKFGGDTDNWMWPRHTGDFSLFRIYADKNNEPAEYSKDNRPYKPIKHFPISLKGVKKGDFTMVFGYPGRTNEYQTSYAVDLLTNTINPERIKIRQSIIDNMSADMASSPSIRIKYASKYARVSNAWKKWIGQNKGLRRIDAIQKKQDLEKKLSQWVRKKSDRKKKYGHLLKEYKELYQAYAPYYLAGEYFYEAIWAMESVKFSSRVQRLLSKKRKVTESDIQALKTYAKKFFKDYNLDTDKKIFTDILYLYSQNAGSDFQPSILDFVKSAPDKKAAISSFAEKYFSGSFYLHKEKFDAFIDSYKYNATTSENIAETPAYQFFASFTSMYYEKIVPGTKKYTEAIAQLDRFYMQALMEYQKEKTFYPDANFTLRVAYGQVDDYKPRDAVSYNYFTTLEGIMEKDNPNIYDYKVPQKLKDLYKKKDYGNYAENGKMHVCFTASNHTTGGNSGSPVLNGNGELIGVNFDRNWEGTMSDIMYDPEQCRNIILDIRYALFIIDKFANSKRLIKEMTIVK